MNTDFVMNNNLITKITDYLIVYCGLVDKHGLQININDDMSREEFMARVARSEFVEWCEVHGNLYGTLKQEIDKTVLAGDNVLLEIDTQGAKKVLSQFDRLVSIFIAPPSELALLNRLRQRDTEDETTLARRLKTASQELKEQHLYDYVVVNEVIEDAVQELISIIDTLNQKES